MKNIVLFFCDITGTIIGKEKNLVSDYQNFHELLLNIKDKEKQKI